ncbi:SIT4-associating protein [Wickerhamomyces ciferrii]|uniref:SIT4-associating protein n=1 Tax=Wickerhamomyces ciferrii (strain ATCC 14091 / BCRC 22168 / CBS 111 / JCM 3599 / NBRC 0793 / NRRL Y-1031 F-60-10) TaxID=1206466 RepID=K0KTE3_WICCF|nr:SIT4-associating protein [Wickerhamomyces ciferrii]CCH46436.1 SIT4-associating protein [Wickerhamomyces ciferrii]
MSGSFWRFNNNFNEVSTINNLLDNGFIERIPSGNSNQRKNSFSSDESRDDSLNQNNYDDDDDDDEQNFAPNLEILDELLDEQDIIEELAQSNIKLIEYLRQREVIEQLIQYIITEEDDLLAKHQQNNNEDNDEQQEQKEEKEEQNNNDNEEQYKSINSSNSDSDSDDLQNFDQPETIQEIHSRRTQVAAEILGADAWSLTDSIMDNHDLLSKLWSILDRSSSLSMNLSTYFMKINERLLDLKIDEMLNFLLNQETLVDRFLRHIDNPPLMDFLLKVISTDKPDSPTGIIDLLKEQNLIEKLISFLKPNVNQSVQSAAGDFIKAFVTISANSNTDNTTIGPNELTRELVSEKIMRKLCNLMLLGGTSLANGVGIIIEIIRKNNSDYDFVPILYITIESHPPTSRDSIYLGHLIKVFSENIPKFAKILQKTKLKEMETPFGSIEPLGFERFKVCELIAELLHCSNMGLLNDEKGEDIVLERDLERERIITLEKLEEQHEQDENFPNDENLNEKVEDDEDDSDHEASKVIDNLNISDETKNDDDQQKDEEVDDDEEKSDKKEDIKSIKSIESNKSEKKPSLEIQSEPDSDVDTTLEIQYDENELIIRKDPVIGDQLKIALADNQVILTILQMFFKFPWNNFLHNVVFDIVQQILNGSMDIGYNKYLSIDLFGRGEITKAIIDGQLNCEQYEINNGLRLGYMGHLTLIAEEVVKFTALYPPNTIHQIIYDAVSTQEWTIYVTETLVDTREKYNALLGGNLEPEDPNQTVDDNEQDQNEQNQQGVIPGEVDDDYHISGRDDIDDDEEDEEGNQNKNEDSGDQFSRYMSQQLTNDLPDKFGSSDEDEEDDDLVGWNNQQVYNSNAMSMNDDDDYEDPNDDGQSYIKKDHPLYSNMLTSRDDDREPPRFADDDEEDDDENFEDDERNKLFRDSYKEDEDDQDDDDDEDEEQEKDDGEVGYGLTRSRSKGELNWDEDEQDRLINVASYMKNNQ